MIPAVRSLTTSAELGGPQGAENVWSTAAGVKATSRARGSDSDVRNSHAIRVRIAFFARALQRRELRSSWPELISTATGSRDARLVLAGWTPRFALRLFGPEAK